MAHEVWAEYYDRIAALIREHRTTLVFVNTRKMAERLARQLADRLGEDQVAAHHGSLSKERRLDAEQRLKHGSVRAVVATASLELGIDIGHVDLVCQVGSPRRISTLLQRVGRAGHTIHGTPKGRVFPETRDDLVECAALLAAVRRGELDRLIAFDAPLDVLAQQIVAESACHDWREDDLYAMVRRAWPYRNLARQDFDAVLRMLADGFTTRRGRRGGLIHRDEVHRRVVAKRSARMTALTSGGAIPDVADYRVVLDPDETFLGTLNEDFAIESNAGDIFQLGNSSWRILQVAGGVVRVADAHGAPPTIPFWLGEAPGRSAELSAIVSDLRRGIEPHLLSRDVEAAIAWLDRRVGCLARGGGADRRVPRRASAQILGALPTQRHDHPRAILRRLGRHAAGAARAVRQPRQSRLGARAAQAVLPPVQLRAAGGGDRGRPAAVAERSACVSARRRVPLSASVDRARHPGAGVPRRAGVPNAVAVERHRVAGGRAHEWRQASAGAVAADARRRSARRRVSGRRRVHREHSRRPADSGSSAGQPDRARLPRRGDGSAAAARRSCAHSRRRAFSCLARDTTEPSPLSHEILNARPYAFLDDAPLEERRAHAVQTRRSSDDKDTIALGVLDAVRDRDGARRGAAGSARCRRAARHAGHDGVSDLGRSERETRMAAAVRRT